MRLRAVTRSWATAVMPFLGLAALLVVMLGLHTGPGHGADGSVTALTGASQQSFPTESVAISYLVPDGSETRGIHAGRAGTPSCPQCPACACIHPACQEAGLAVQVTGVPLPATDTDTGAPVALIQPRSVACRVPAAAAGTVSLIQLSVRRI